MALFFIEIRFSVVYLKLYPDKPRVSKWYMTMS